MSKSKRFTFCIFLMWTLVLAACTTSASPSPETAAHTIDCLVAYRPSVSVGFEREETVSLSAATPAQTLSFTDLVFHAQYWPGNQPPNEHGLRLWVTPADREKELVSQLYQFSLIDSVRNQFLGNHGFTGLSYVYHPESRAELQYTCKSK